MSDITRSEAIKTLKEHLSHWERLLQEHICEEQEGIDTISALKLAIADLETDDLTHCQHTDKEIAQSFREDVEAVKDLLPTKNDLGVDAVSRKELLKIYEDRFSELQKLKHLKDNKGAEDRQMGVNYCINILKELAPVTPIRPKGHWIRVTDKAGHLVWECDKCGWQQRFNTNYCPDCGSYNGGDSNGNE